MTARPDHQTDAETWCGGWINFYQYRGGQSHLGKVVCATRAEADAVRAAWFAADAEYTKHGFILTYWIDTGNVYEVRQVLDRIPDNHPTIVKAKNCYFSIAIPHVASDDRG